MLELYHNINSVCAQKVRIAMAEKGLTAKEHLLTLHGDQNEPAYMKLNPNGVIPTLVHDGQPIVESSLILYYLDEVFPAPALMPTAPRLRFRVRMFNKLIDEYGHNACTFLTFGTAFRQRLLDKPRAAALAELSKAPLRHRALAKIDVLEHGTDSEHVAESVRVHMKLLSWMSEALKEGPYLAGDAFSNADCAVIPYILRLELLKLSGMYERHPSVVAWWSRMRERPSVKSSIFDRMTDEDWAPFKNLKPDPWPKVRELLAKLGKQSAMSGD